MSRKENQKQKLFRILEMFIRRTDYDHGLTVEQIREELEEYGIKAERKSLYDDFRVLGELGFEVEKMSTRPTTYTISNRVFELAELKLLVDAIQASKFISEKRSRELIDKLKLFAGVYGAGELQRYVHVEGRAKTANDSTIYITDSIHYALNNNRKIKFKYYKYSSKKKKEYGHEGEFYVVSPLALIWQAERYYLVACDDRDGMVKHYRIDKMESVSWLDEPRDPVALCNKIDPASYSQKTFGMYGGAESLVTLECRESLANVIIDRFGTDVTFFQLQDGFRISVRVQVSPTFFGWLAELGDGVTLTAPADVRKDYCAFLRKILANYEG